MTLSRAHSRAQLPFSHTHIKSISDRFVSDGAQAEGSNVRAGNAASHFLASQDLHSQHSKFAALNHPDRCTQVLVLVGGGSCECTEKKGGSRCHTRVSVLIEEIMALVCIRTRSLLHFVDASRPKAALKNPHDTLTPPLEHGKHLRTLQSPSALSYTNQ